MDLASAYRDARLRIAELAKDLTDEQLDRPNRACPEWTVRDTLYHQAGLAEDVSTGNMEGAPAPVWSWRQINSRKGASVQTTLHEWGAAAERLEPMIAANPDRMTFVVADVGCHKIDLRAALDLPVDKDTELIAWMASNFVRVFDSKLRKTSLPPIRILADGREWVAGEAEPENSVKAPSTFELVRALSGRRSLDQIRAWDWSTDPGPYLAHFSVFEPRRDDLNE